MLRSDDLPRTGGKTTVRHIAATVTVAVLACVFVVAWSWSVSPIYVPLGSHWIGFGRSYTRKRPPPAWYRFRRMSPAIQSGAARGRIFPLTDGRYFIGWQ